MYGVSKGNFGIPFANNCREVKWSQRLHLNDSFLVLDSFPSRPGRGHDRRAWAVAMLRVATTAIFAGQWRSPGARNGGHIQDQSYLRFGSPHKHRHLNCTRAAVWRGRLVNHPAKPDQPTIMLGHTAHGNMAWTKRAWCRLQVAGCPPSPVPTLVSWGEGGNDGQTLSVG